QRRRRPVVVDHDAVEQVRVGAPGADRAEVLADLLDRLVHAVARVEDDVVEIHGCLPLMSSPGGRPGVAQGGGTGRSDVQMAAGLPAVTSVPTGSPRTTRPMLPSRNSSNTTIGSPLSMHSEMAVASITPSPWLSTDRKSISS